MTCEYIYFQTQGMVDNPIVADNFASLFNCSRVGQSSDSRTGASSICFRWFAPDYLCLWSGPSWSCLWFSCVLASDRHWPFASFHLSVFDCILVCFIVMLHRWGRSPLCGPNIYRILSNYRTVRLGFSKVLGTLICGKICIYLLRIHYKKVRKWLIWWWFCDFFSDFLYIKTYVVGTHLNCIDKSM